MPKYHRLARLLEIVDVVKSNSHLRPRDLAGMFGISEKRIYDDIGDLNMAGVPIVFHQGGYKILPSYFQAGALFSPEEAFRITLGLNLLVQQNVLDEATRRRLLDKLFGTVANGTAGDLSQLSARTLAGPCPENRVAPGVLEALCAAISANRAVSVTYLSVARGQENDRELHPYFLVHKKNAWYLVAYCCERGEVRTFKAGRFRSVEPLSRTFSPPPLEDYVRDLDERWGIMGGRLENIVVRFDPTVAAYIREKHIPRATLTNHRDGGLTLSLSTRGLDEFSWWLLQYGPHARVEKPQRLRDKMARYAREMTDLYAAPSKGRKSS
ncbi:WYL domain-containing protein [bacterium]|nr:WYL domain-containing protein [bacterium]